LKTNREGKEEPTMTKMTKKKKMRKMRKMVIFKRGKI
jgi:hypothetical protein